MLGITCRPDLFASHSEIRDGLPFRETSVTDLRNTWPADPAGALAPQGSAVTIAHVVYALHSLAIAVGILGSATIVGSFLGSIPSILGVILSYVKRRDARGTWLASHYRWQIRTFWFALLWLMLAGLLFITLIGIPLALFLLAVMTVWIVYRIVRGWVRLSGQRAMYA
jgi:uncharacterized membrane protein